MENSGGGKAAKRWPLMDFGCLADRGTTSGNPFSILFSNKMRTYTKGNGYAGVNNLY